MTHDTEPREPACRQPPETIVVQIRKYVEPFLSAIGAVEVGDSRDPPGDHIGTGAFIVLGGVRYLLTCDHVAQAWHGVTLACDLFKLGGAIKVANPFVTVPFPVDVAASPISNRSWTCVSHNATCLTVNDFALSHSPVDGEYLYVGGFPGEWAHEFPGEPHHVQLAELFSVEVPFDPALKTEYQKPIDGYHLCLDCNPEHVKRLLGDHSWVAKLGD